MISLEAIISWSLPVRMPTPVNDMEQQETCHPSAHSSEIEVAIANGS
jgi:hypothetical protein